MKYLFEKAARRYWVTCGMQEIAERTKELEADGFFRVWEAPNVVIVPGYWEAKEESEALADDPWMGGKKMPFEKMMEV